MSRPFAVGTVLSAFAAIFLIGSSATPSAKELKVVSDKTVTGFKFPESVGCDPRAKVLYASEFGGSELKPGEKDGKGKISKLSLTGEVLDEQFLPLPGEVLNKPKGNWIKGNRLWVTDIDVVWIFAEVGNRLPDPAVLPIPSNAHWLPLASFIQAPFVSVLGPTALANALPGVLIGSLAAPLTWLIARDSGARPIVGVAAGVISAIPGAVST